MQWEMKDKILINGFKIKPRKFPHSLGIWIVLGNDKTFLSNSYDIPHNDLQFNHDWYASTKNGESSTLPKFPIDNILHS